MKTKTVLIADDDQSFVRVLEDRCRNLGLKVLTAPDTMSALTLIHKDPPDLILLDVHMPAGNGLAACEMLSTDTRLAPIPVIILTGKSDDETIQRCESLGAHYVPKSSQMWDSLKPIICELLEISASPRSIVKERPMVSQAPKVLVIDDDPEISRALKIRLRPYGLEVLPAFSGMQGYWTAFRENPDVIITDYKMPEGHGDFAVGRLRMHKLTQDIPVIVLTGYNVDGQTDHGLQRDLYNLGVTTILTKPLDFENLLDALRLHIEVPDSPAQAVVHGPAEPAVT